DMNIATRNVPVVKDVPPVWKMTLALWWRWKSATTNANTTMPRISNRTPVLLTIAMSRTPKMFMTVIAISATTAIQRWLEWLFARFQPMLLKAGISANGSVAHTDATVRIPAKR